MGVRSALFFCDGEVRDILYVIHKVQNNRPNYLSPSLYTRPVQAPSPNSPRKGDLPLAKINEGVTGEVLIIISIISELQPQDISNLFQNGRKRGIPGHSARGATRGP